MCRSVTGHYSRVTAICAAPLQATIAVWLLYVPLRPGPTRETCATLTLGYFVTGVTCSTCHHDPVQLCYVSCGTCVTLTLWHYSTGVTPLPSATTVQVWLVAAWLFHSVTCRRMRRRQRSSPPSHPLHDNRIYALQSAVLRFHFINLCCKQLFLIFRQFTFRLQYAALFQIFKLEGGGGGGEAQSTRNLKDGMFMFWGAFLAPDSVAIVRPVGIPRTWLCCYPKTSRHSSHLTLLLSYDQ